MKLKESGDVEWTKTLGGSNFEIFFDIARTPSGGYVVSG